jgi:hypothetical protein
MLCTNPLALVLLLLSCSSSACFPILSSLVGFVSLVLNSSLSLSLCSISISSAAAVVVDNDVSI